MMARCFLMLGVVFSVVWMGWAEDVPSTPAAGEEEAVSVSAEGAEASSGEAATPVEASEPAPKAVEKRPVAPKVTPKAYGERRGEVYIGLRTVITRRTGWGWIKKEGEDWSSAQWAMLQETPGVIQAPGRFLSNPNQDNLMTYKLYGEFSADKGYEPEFDVFIPVFRLKGFEVVGKGEPIGRKPPYSQGFTQSSSYSRPGPNSRLR